MIRLIVATELLCPLIIHIQHTYCSGESLSPVHSHSNYSLTSPSNIGIAVELMFNEYPTTAICKLSCESLPIPLESKNYPSSLPDNIVLTIRVLYAGMVYIFYLPIFWKSNVILCDLLLLLCPKIWQSCSKKFYLRNHLKLW